MCLGRDSQQSAKDESPASSNLGGIRGRIRVGRGLHRGSVVVVSALQFEESSDDRERGPEAGREAKVDSRVGHMLGGVRRE